MRKDQIKFDDEQDKIIFYTYNYEEYLIIKSLLERVTQ